MMDDQNIDTPEQSEFRAYARDWLNNNHPGKPPMQLPQVIHALDDPEALKWLQGWQCSAYEAGLIGCDYSADVGGGGREGCQRIANEEMLAANTPSLPNIMGLGMAAPTIYFHARDELKQRLLPKLFSGEEIWCQGFSEPGAGSDLANQQTFARRDGDNWVINGHKIWTTSAHFASWMILLCRTDKADKYNGLSYFVVPIKSNLDKGVTVRPLIKMTGETGFNEVLFEDVVIPDDYRLDEVGAGWKVAMTTLNHERHAGPMVTPTSTGSLGGEESDVSTQSPMALIELAKSQVRNGMSAAQDPLLRDELVKLYIRQEAFDQNVRRGRVAALVDDATRIPLQYKMVLSEIRQDLARIAYQVQGHSSSFSVADDKAPDGGAWPLAYMDSFAITIAGGSNQVQRNILGERVLGLPKSK